MPPFIPEVDDAFGAGTIPTQTIAYDTPTLALRNEETNEATTPSYNKDDVWYRLGGSIAGLVVGSIAGAVLIGLLVWFLVRLRRKRKQRQTSHIADKRSSTPSSVEEAGTTAPHPPPPPTAEVGR
ncbi:hypothetical protein ACRE_019510 [Hapsidospora chrysogenum ATCC 11550]|uniref:Uncharacterized protein n=1 Tax=Hapsidospora chrysogenum (strain ATCC 11550 / CBS 779.69 / DSM 880 / IAM 14645 / JCM 23072 / IMI 49137) TaxID=857340 RepID=A0A086TCM3_HAPC1|nr:hypothetical protein ACRE_019510 [Hapsidospora chrysogenum ATCC 11550]